MKKVIVPAAFPNITERLHIALGTGWVFLVVGEMLGVQSGLGYLSWNSACKKKLQLSMKFKQIAQPEAYLSYVEDWVEPRNAVQKAFFPACTVTQKGL